MIDVDFLDSLLKKYNMPNTNAYIADSNSRILVCTQNDRIGRTGNTAGYILMIGRAAAIQSGKSETGEQLHYGLPVMGDGAVEYVVVTYGTPENIEKVGKTIQVALQTALEYSEYEHKKNITPREKQDAIAVMLLSDKPDKDRICSLMYSNEMEPDLLRAVIYIHLEYHRNTYFNINLNLGYEAAIEKLRLEVANKIRKSRFMNTQDIVYVPDRNTILIIKSFINTENISRVYSALDAVCKDLVNILGGYSSFGFSISYGNFYRGVDELYMSWKEAYEMFKLGKASGSSNFYNLDNLLFEYISKHMESQIENKFVIPAVKKLTDGNGEVMLQLAENAEAYVDSCMSLSKASETLGIHRNTVFSRLKRFEDITGLKTSESFRDAFLTKLIAVYLKSEEYRKEDLI